MWMVLRKSTRVIGAAVVVDVDQLGEVAEVPRESAIDWQGRKRLSLERGLDLHGHLECAQGLDLARLEVLALVEHEKAGGRKLDQGLDAAEMARPVLMKVVEVEYHHEGW